MVESDAQQKTITLSRREQFEILQSFEEENDICTNDKDLEDVTEEIFGVLGHLERCEMLCKTDMDLFDTMSCIEVMDPKMDMRMKRKEALTPTQALKQEILIPGQYLDQPKLEALLDEFLV